MLPFPDKKYQIIYADPPWKYNDKGCNGNAESHYQTMTLNDICNLKVQDIADTNCVLFMWATYPMLSEALKVIKSWGFNYKSIGFQWIKLNRKSKTPFCGLGRWTRGNTEPCLLATKGKPHRIAKDVFQLIQEPIQKHSQKPDRVRKEIVRLMGELPRIELFARQKTAGWDAWGNEIIPQRPRLTI